MTENVDPAEPQAPPSQAPSRDVSAYWRDKAAKIEALLAEADKALTGSKAEHEATLAKLRAEHAAALEETAKAAQGRLIRAELRALAIKDGIRDPSDLALLDVSGVKTGPDGNIVDGEAVIAAFKAAKPHLFGAASSSSPAPAPPNNPPPAKPVREMTPAEYAAAKAAITRRR